MREGHMLFKAAQSAGIAKCVWGLGSKLVGPFQRSSGKPVNAALRTPPVCRVVFCLPLVLTVDLSSQDFRRYFRWRRNPVRKQRRR